MRWPPRSCATPSAVPRPIAGTPAYYPSVNATYYVSDALVARAAFAQTIGRPSLTAIIPGITVSDPAPRPQPRRLSTAALKPWTANNYDLSLESYNFRGATAAFSLFKKDIKGFFTSTQIPATSALLQSFGLGDEYLNYTIITQANGGSATVEGYESELAPGALFPALVAKGFSTYANVTSRT